jgi:hypothetical protein
MPLAGFEPTIPASARPQTYALDRAATGIGNIYFRSVYLVKWLHFFLSFMFLALTVTLCNDRSKFNYYITPSCMDKNRTLYRLAVEASANITLTAYLIYFKEQLLKFT